METWLVIATIGLPWLGALCVWWVGDTRPRMQHTLAAAFSVMAGIVSLLLLLFPADAVVLLVPMGSFFGDFTLVADGLGVFLSIVAAGIGSLAIIFSIDYMADEAQLGRYYALVLLFIGAMAGLALAGSLLLMFLFWEITAFCSYALISFHNDDPKAVAGGIKALIITQFSGMGLLAGALVIYAYLGSYQISTFLADAQTLPRGVLSLIAFGFLAAAAGKSAQVPFQTWLPDGQRRDLSASPLLPGF
jgi:NADH-quinone oxidoreductase subunit L